jgi:hypothetical protein
VSNARLFLRLVESFNPHGRTTTNPPRATPCPAVQPLLSSRSYPSHLICSYPHLILSPIAAAAQHHAGHGRRLSNLTWSSATGCNSSAPGLPCLELFRSCSIVPTMGDTDQQRRPPMRRWDGGERDASIRILNIARGAELSRGRRRWHVRQSRRGWRQWPRL